MEYRKNIMKNSLAENLRYLMQRKVFEKITIKQICDETGVIRATFYNYFEDKYDCLNWIVHMDLSLSDTHEDVKKDYSRFILIALANIEKNKEFYKVAYNVVGQNGFEEIINNCYAESVLTFLNEKRDPDILPQYSNELLSQYYGQTLAFITKQFVFDKTNPSILETRKKALDLMSHSIIDYEKKF